MTTTLILHITVSAKQVRHCQLALLPHLPQFLFLGLCVQYKEAEECEKWGRPGSTYHVNDVQWMQGVPSTRNRAHTMWELTCAKLGRNAPFNADQGLSTASYGSHYYAFHCSTSSANARHSQQCIVPRDIKT